MKTIEEWIEYWRLNCRRDVVDTSKMPGFIIEVRSEAMAEGIHAGLCLAAYLHEGVNPACDHQRETRTSGAGAMGAVIEYRDLIRSEADARSRREKVVKKDERRHRWQPVTPSQLHGTACECGDSNPDACKGTGS